MSIQTRLTTKQRQQRSARCSITTDTQLAGGNVAASLDAENCKEDGEVIADVVDVLLGVYEFSESCDSIVCEKVMLSQYVSVF